MLIISSSRRKWNRLSSFSIVREMFQDASSLISGGNSIINAPGCSTRDAFFVSNDKDRLNPFVITVQNATIKCQQEKCVKYAACNICSHSIAIAERLALLADFLANFNRVNRCNLSRLTDIGQPKNAAKKATKATQRRKGAADQQKKGPRAYKSYGSASFSASAPAPTAALDQVQLLVTAPATSNTATTRQQPNAASALPIPPEPNPLPGSYVITLLKFCHENTSVCHGCRGSLREENGAIPEEPRDLVIVTKGRREYYNHKGLNNMDNFQMFTSILTPSV